MRRSLQFGRRAWFIMNQRGSSPARTPPSAHPTHPASTIIESITVSKMPESMGTSLTSMWFSYRGRLMYVGFAITATAFPERRGTEEGGGGRGQAVLCESVL